MVIKLKLRLRKNVTGALMRLRVPILKMGIVNFVRKNVNMSYTNQIHKKKY